MRPRPGLPKGSILVLLLCLFSPGRAEAVLYHFVDGDGVHHFSNVPDDPRYRPYGLAWRGGYGSVYDGRGFSSNFGRLDYDHLITKAAAHHGLDSMLVRAVIKVESNFNPNAISRKGAQGLMQLMPDTARDMRVRDPFSPEENIFAGARYLRMLLDLFGNDLSLSLAAYNAGPNTVKTQGAIPQIRETRDYVQKVLTIYRSYQQQDRSIR